MHQDYGYSAPNYGQSPFSNGKYRLLFLGFLFPILHYVIMLAVQIAATSIATIHYMSELGAIATEEVLKEKTLEFLTKYSDLFSIVSSLLTVLLVLLVYHIICSRLQKHYVTPPSPKEYFSLRKIDKKLVFKLILLAFFFYHLVLGFLNLINYLSPDLMQSYNKAAESIDVGSNPIYLLLSFVALVIAVPLVEELIYRNMAIENLQSRMPAVGAVFVSSIIFGIFHGDFVWMLYAMGLGLLFGFLYVKSSSIFVSWIVHTVFNLIGYVYSMLDNLIDKNGLDLVNTVSFVLILISLLGAPLVFLWVWKTLSKQSL